MKPALIAILLFSAASTLTSSPLSSAQKSWLQKAERHEKNGWIYLHIEGAPAEHPQFNWMAGILKGRPAQQWAQFRAGEKN